MVSGRGARAKGHSWEREVAIRLREIDPGAKRNVEECQEAGLDIKTSLPLGIQCKAFAKWTTTADAVLLQAALACSPSQMPVGIVKINNKEPLALVYLDDFLDMVKKLYGPKEDSPHCA